MCVSSCLGTMSFSAGCTELLEHKVTCYLLMCICMYTCGCRCKCTCTTGQHPCFWCTIRTDQLKQPRHARGPLPPRTLDSLQADSLRFSTTGKADIRKAKDFNNVIGPVFFNVPLSQVNLTAHKNIDRSCSYVKQKCRSVFPVFILLLACFIDSGHCWRKPVINLIWN